ncbi:hypothetical protein Tco_0181953, partial [Tanacetum coccineum]
GKSEPTSPKYPSALGAAISKAIEKGMQDGLSAGITHGKEGRVLTDVAAHNPSTEVDYIFCFATTSKCPLAEKLGLNELQPNVDQLMVPIHHSPGKVVVGATALSLALDVFSVRVRKIRENIANHILVLRDVFVPLAEPLYAADPISTEGTSDIVSAAANTTTALSTTFSSTSTVRPITIEDYEIIGTNGLEDDQG